MRFVLIFSLLMVVPALAEESKFPIPQENQVKGTMPDLADAETLAQRLVESIATNDTDSAKDLFFPGDAFGLLKDMKGSEKYYAQLVSWYKADVTREHERIKSKSALIFDGFTKGNCAWKDKGSEHNKIAYWSCYHNKFYAKSGNERIKFELRTMINWGSRWFVTHLGPIPK